MSLIERALQRARSADQAARVSSTQDNDVLGAKAFLPQPAELVRVAPNPDLVITDAMLRDRGLFAPAVQERQQRAEYRRIKYGLLEEIRRPDANRTVLVTSALEGEGKSFSSAHLALSLATEPDHAVLLIDADVIRQSLSRQFGLEKRAGLMDAVANPLLDAQSLIVSTNIEGFSVLPAGQPNERATEYFASNRMYEVFGQLTAVKQRIVVIDSLPLLQTTEARALADVAGQVVLVVRAASTPQAAVMQAVQLLGTGANVKLLLNAAVRSRALDYLGLGYGYEYSGQEKTP